MVKRKKANNLDRSNEGLAVQDIGKKKQENDLVISNKEIEKQQVANKKLELLNFSAKEAARYARSLIEVNLDALLTISIKGTITDVNKASIQVTGVSREILIGTAFSNYFTEPKKAQKANKQAFKEGIISDYPLTIKHIDGHLTDVLYSASVNKDEKGNVLGVFAAARDITEQKRAEAYLIKSAKEISDYKYALDEFAIVAITDEKGVIIHANDNFCNISQYTRGEIIGQDHRIINSGYHSKEFMSNLWSTIQKGKIWKGKLKNKAKDGTFYWVDTTIVPFLNELGKPYQYVAVRRDITAQRKIEAELTEAKDKAEKAVKEAEIAVKSKQQFLSNMSHEIRTPMTAILGFTKVMLKTNLDFKQKEYLNAIKISGDALIVLINDILDLAKVDAGKMKFEQIPFKIKSSILAMLHLFDTKIQEKNLELVIQYDNRIPDVLVGDPVRLQQIVLNILSNAVKFTEKGKISVNINLLSENDDMTTIEIVVIDTGIGIAEDKLEKIFESFQQASSGTSRLYGGTGLGLAIVKQLVETQGGTIKTKSKMGIGSTFSFSLNFLKTNAIAETEIETELMELDSEIKNINVLVVEDILLNQLLMKTLLDDFGFDRDIASNGKIAIERLKAKPYDVILMDLQMPEMNGFECSTYIRNKMNSKVPIIALTADVTTADLEKCTAVGMNDYISKPVDERVLYRKIVGMVSKSKQQKVNEVSESSINKKVKCVDLSYLNQRTKSHPVLMKEMILAYLEQTPPLISAMKQSFHDKDWISLDKAVHKMIPSFSIMGIHPDFENMAKKVQEYAIVQQQEEGLSDLVFQLENVCMQACKELEEELKMITNKNL